jgi:hypothetical protein
MQSFKVCCTTKRPPAGGVLVGCLTDPAGLAARSVATLRRIAATRRGGWAIRGSCHTHATAAAGSPAAFMLRWARRLVVDRTVLVYARCATRSGPASDRSSSSPISRNSGRRLLTVVSGQWSVVSWRTVDAAVGRPRSRSAFVSFPKVA